MKFSIFIIVVISLSYSSLLSQSSKVENDKDSGKGNDSSGDDKVIGGRDAVRGERPYQVAVLENGNLICGGSVLGEKVVVTAAHCIRGYVLY